MSSEILSSTGDLGLQLRQLERAYLNWRFGIVEDGRFIERQARRAQEALDRGIASRVVGRLFLSYEAFRDSYRNSALVQEGLEAAIEFESSDDDSVVMAMYGFNSPNRRPIVPVERMVEDTRGLVIHESPRSRTNGLREEGITFIDRIEQQFVNGILELWGPTFGWSAAQVNSLRNRLTLQERMNPRAHSVWFSAALFRGQVISLATAERLSMPFIPKFNLNMNIIESTEWRTRQGWESRGIMAATAAHLNAQIIQARGACCEDYRIIAETNYLSHTHRVGAAIGMQVPEREYYGGIIVPQVLRQNVEVHDGLEPTGLRDFIFMELPFSVIRREYSDTAVREILGRRV